MEAASKNVTPSLGGESALRHPAERPYFIASVILNFLLMGLAIVFVVHTPAWVKEHAFIAKEVMLLRVLAISALVAIPGAVLIRNRRRALVAGDSVRLSPGQFPEIYAILTEQCRQLGISDVPEIYLTVGTIRPFSEAFSSWHENFIVLHQIILDIDYRKSLDIVAFAIGHELGAIRLNHTAWWNDMLLTYVSTIKWLINPLKRARVYSRDRYGAYLAPTGFRGLLIYAVGRRLMNDMNIKDYLNQANQYGGFWAELTILTQRKPSVLHRLRELQSAGFDLELPPAIKTEAAPTERDRR
jgi:uncharacterized membrane protein YoaK (UPF0700 family)